MTAERSIFCSQVFLPEGWKRNIRLQVSAGGRISSIAEAMGPDAGDERIEGPVVPAMTNLHSHSFQRAMAGLAEVSGEGEDSFWTWRTMMYRLVSTLSPEDIEAITAKLYSELLKGGYGRIVEFHYLHHARGGQCYDLSGETSLRISNAAQSVGIGLTHLPVFYAHSGFGGLPPTDGQKPFIHSVGEFLTLLDDLRAPFAAAGHRLGFAIHSLRAATPDQMRSLLSEGPKAGPIHIHVAEQEKEVEDCLAWSGRRPVEWLLDEMPVDARWCAIHATHMTDDEAARLARSGAVAGLCPATEANLGDGIFPATDFLRHGGAIGIGTDSHIATSVAEEVRILEYSQRLRDRRRNRLADGPNRSVGTSIFNAALAGGAQAAGVDKPGLRVGASADLVVLDPSSPFIAATEDDRILDRWLFALGPDVVRHVMVSGRWVIRDRRHERDDEIDREFQKVLRKVA